MFHIQENDFNRSWISLNASQTRYNIGWVDQPEKEGAKEERRLLGIEKLQIPVTLDMTKGDSAVVASFPNHGKEGYIVGLTVQFINDAQNSEVLWCISDKLALGEKKVSTEFRRGKSSVNRSQTEAKVSV